MVLTVSRRETQFRELGKMFLAYHYPTAPRSQCQERSLVAKDLREIKFSTLGSEGLEMKEGKEVGIWGRVVVILFSGSEVMPRLPFC